MASIIKCLAAKAEFGYITKARFKEVEAAFNEAKVGKAAGTKTEEEYAFAQSLYDRYNYRVQKRQQQLVQHLDLVEKTEEIVDQAIAKGASYRDIAKGLITRDDDTRVQYGDVFNQSFLQKASAYRTLYASLLKDTLDAFTPKRGINIESDFPLQKEVAREVFARARTGQSVSADPKIKKMAEQIQAITDRGARDLDARGAEVFMRKDYLFGMFPDRLKIGGVSKQDFIQYMRDIDIQPTEFANFKFKDAAQKDAVMSALYDDIVSGSLNKIGDFLPKGLKSLSRGRKFNRVLEFGNADDWTAFQMKFGQGSLYNTLMNYTSRISREMAQLETMGPKPEAFKNSIIRKFANKSPKEASHIKSYMDDWFEYAMNDGINPAYLDPSGKWGNVFSVIRTTKSITSSAILGKVALLNVLSDMMNIPVIVRSMTGLKSVNTQLNGFKQLFSGKRNAYTRDLLFSVGVALDSHMDAFTRLMTEELAGKVEGGADWISRVMRKVTGTDRTVTSGKQGAEMAFLSGLAIDLKGLTNVEDIFNSRLGLFLKRQGLTTKDLELIKKHSMRPLMYPGQEGEGVILDPNQLFRSNDDAIKQASVKLTAAAQQYGRKVGLTRSDAMSQFVHQSKKGSPGLGAAVEISTYLFGYTTAFYKNVFKSLLVDDTLSAVQRGKGVAGLLTGLMVANYTYAQISNILSGKDPEPLQADSALRAFTSLAPVLGNLLSNSGVGYGTQDMPILSTPLNLLDLTVGNATSALRGQRTSFGADTVRLVKNLMPGQNGWFTGLIFNRYIIDNLSRLIDPKHEERFRREKSRAKGRGGGYFWGPGEAFPDRLPDISKAFAIGKN